MWRMKLKILGMACNGLALKSVAWLPGLALACIPSFISCLFPMHIYSPVDVSPKWVSSHVCHFLLPFISEKFLLWSILHVSSFILFFAFSCNQLLNSVKWPGREKNHGAHRKMLRSPVYRIYCTRMVSVKSGKQQGDLFPKRSNGEIIKMYIGGFQVNYDQKSPSISGIVSQVDKNICWQ